MGTRTADLEAELLRGGLGKVTAACSISGGLKANSDGVALVLRAVTSLFAPPPSVATHIFEAAVAADSPGSGIAGGSNDPMVETATAALSPGGSEEEEIIAETLSDCGSESSVKSSELAAGGNPNQRLARAEPKAAVVDTVAIATAVGGGPPPTMLGLAVADESLSAQLAGAWAAYPKDLHQSLSDDLFGRLADNMEGAAEPLEAALCYFCALVRDPRLSFNADEFWPGAKKFARDERKLMATPIPIWLPCILEALAAAVRERASQAPGQSSADTRAILKRAIPPTVKGRRAEFADIETAIRSAYPVGASIGRRARLVGATWALRMTLHVAAFVREAGQPEASGDASYADIAALYDVPPATLARCLMLAAEGVPDDPTPASAGVDPTKKYRLSPDEKFMGWAHCMKAINEQHGVAWQGNGLTAVEVEPHCLAYPPNIKVGVVRDTCLVKARPPSATIGSSGRNPRGKRVGFPTS